LSQVVLSINLLSNKHQQYHWRFWLAVATYLRSTCD